MDENKIYLTRDKTIWFDLEKKQVFDSDVPVGLQPLQIGVLRHLLENKEKFCSYAEIYGDVWYGAHHGDKVLITGAINKINLNYSRLCRESGRKPHNYRILTAHCFSSIK